MLGTQFSLILTWLLILRALLEWSFLCEAFSNDFQ